VPDEVCKGLDRLAAYEYRPPALDDEIAAGTAPQLLDVEILGHIFEQSISDLEQVHQEIAKGSEPEAEPAKAGPSRQNELSPISPEAPGTAFRVCPEQRSEP
jgi:hypothetical protein